MLEIECSHAYECMVTSLWNVLVSRLVYTCTLRACVHAVSDCAIEGMAYKRRSADLVIETEDKVGF